MPQLRVFSDHKLLLILFEPYVFFSFYFLLSKKIYKLVSVTEVNNQVYPNVKLSIVNIK